MKTSHKSDELKKKIKKGGSTNRVPIYMYSICIYTIYNVPNLLKFISYITLQSTTFSKNIKLS